MLIILVIIEIFNLHLCVMVIPLYCSTPLPYMV